jgi:cysteinyl-tRNA synthetase
VVNHWAHGDHLLFSGQKMAKSAGNVWTLDDVEAAGLHPRDFRYLCLTGRYRRQLRFSPDALAAAGRAVARLRQHLADWGEPAEGLASGAKEWDSRFRSAVLDDLDFPRALRVVWELVGTGDLAPADKAALLLDWEAVLGLGLGEETQAGPAELPAGAAELLEARARARAEHRYEDSDRLRAELGALGVEVTDTREGTTWHLR